MPRLVTVLACLATLSAGIASATIFRIDTSPPKTSVKVGKLTADEIMSVCAFEKRDDPFFTDKEYQAGIKEYEMAAKGESDAKSPKAQRLQGNIEALKECRENDRNKRHAAKAKRSCKDLVKSHKAASASAWDAVENKTAYRDEIMSWGERFREPVELCLKSMRCRYNSKKDMAEAVAVYREVVDEMSGWILDVKNVEDMHICGTTIRDLKRWCQVETGTDAEGNTKIKDICTDPEMMAIALQKLQEPITRRPLPHSSPSPLGGGHFGVGGQ